MSIFAHIGSFLDKNYVEIAVILLIIEIVAFCTMIPFFGLDFVRPKRLEKMRLYRNLYSSIENDWKEKINNRSELNAYDFDKIPSFIEIQNGQDRFTENMLLLLAGGGILWLGSVHQGSPESIGKTSIIGGVLLIGSLLCIALIRINLVGTANFRRGEWYKNIHQYELEIIKISELYWRTNYLWNMKRAALGLLALSATLLTLGGYIMICLSLLVRASSNQ